MNIKAIILAACTLASAMCISSCSKGRPLVDDPATGDATYEITSFFYETSAPNLTDAQRKQASIDLEDALRKDCVKLIGKDYDFAKVAFDGAIIPYTGSDYKPYSMDIVITCYKGGLAIKTYTKKSEGV